MLPWAIFVLIGPGESTLKHCQDLFESIVTYEQSELHQCDLVIVNDQNTGIDQLQPYFDQFRSLTMLDNPSNDGARIWDRLGTGILTALGPLCRAEEYAFVVKIDTDALVINSFSQRLRTLFEQSPTKGVIGTVHLFPDGEVNQGLKTLQHLIDNAARRIPKIRWVRKFHPKNPVRAFYNLVTKYPKRRALVEKALERGYQSAEHAVGGAYAINGRMIKSLGTTVDIPQPLDFEGTLIPEDLLIAFWAVAEGYELSNYNRSGEVFGIWWRAPSMTPEELAAANFGIVHSVKDGDGFEDFDEQAFRSWFRQRRAAFAEQQTSSQT